MKLPKFMTRLGDALKFSALSELPTQPPPKPPKPGGLAYPGFRKNTVASASAIPKPRFDVTNVDLTSTHRNGATTPDTVRALSRISPEMSGAISAALRVSPIRTSTP